MRSRGSSWSHPFYERKVPIVLGEHVTLDAGTGLVHTAPAHGLEDYQVGQKYNLPADNPVDDDGRFFEGMGLVGGLTVWEANKVIVDALAKEGRLLHSENIQHSYPHCWRHKTPVIYRATRQWFIAMDSNHHPGGGPLLREVAEKAVQQTEFFPSWGRARLEAMIHTRPDWCISRQRNWGTPLALFVHGKTGELHPRTAELIEQVAQRVERQGIEGWFSLDAEDLLGSDAEHYRKVPDTMDVWFDSGTTHLSVLERRADLAKPADLYLEGTDQHRGWFQASLLTGCAIDGRAPYRQLLTHGFAIDGEGRKMSKSMGNVIAPQEVSERLGAEILRLWVASTDYSGELSLSQEILKRVVEMYRRIRNTLRFLLANVSDFDAARDAVPVERWIELDRYALAVTRELQDAVMHDYGRYEFHFVVQRLHNFCSEFLGGFYLDILKDRLYTCAAASPARRSAQSALWHIANSLLRLFAPVLSFTADEAWSHFMRSGEAEPERDSVFLHCVHDLPSLTDADQLRQRWALIREVRAEVQKELEAVRVSGADRLVARGRGRDSHQCRTPPCAGRTGRRPAVRPDHLRRRGQGHGRSDSSRRSSCARACMRSVRAAGTTGPISDRTRPIRSCAAAVYPTCMGRVRRACMLEHSMPRTSTRRWLAWLVVSAGVVVLDQLSKHFVRDALANGRSIRVTPFFDLVLILNPGAAFSFLSSAAGWQRELFIGIALGGQRPDPLLDAQARRRPRVLPGARPRSWAGRSAT